MQYSILIAIIFSVSLLMVFYFPQAYGIFHREDFVITDYGVKNGNPFMTVQGEAGRSVSVDMGDESYYAYTFVTDKGVFASTVALGVDESKPYYSADSFQVEKFEIGACLEDGDLTGTPKFSGKTVEFIPQDFTIMNLSKVYTLQVTSDDPDDDCQSGNHIYKMFASN